MARLHLRLYNTPGQAEIFVNLRQIQGGYYKYAATIDTGAETSFFPNYILPQLVHRQSEVITIQQAGIAQQQLTVTQAYVWIYLEDTSGVTSSEFETLAWFANTDLHLVGFGGILERGILHIDMPSLQGYLELP